MGKYSPYWINPNNVSIGTRVAKETTPRTIGIVLGLDPEATTIDYSTKIRILWLNGKNRGKVQITESHRLFNFTVYKQDSEDSHLRITTASNEAETFLKTLPDLQHLQGTNNEEEQ